MENIRVPLPDELGQLIQLRFQHFLTTFAVDHDYSAELTEQHFLDNYQLQIEKMISCNKSTVYVDFAHLQLADEELALAVKQEFLRFEPYLRYALHCVVAQDNPQYIFDLDRGQREFFVAFYNLPHIAPIRAMRTHTIGSLLSLSGTVTRSTEVRPELFYASFVCTKCGTQHTHIEQQLSYTEPTICRSPQCGNKRFDVLVDKSSFVDWQRVRVQEHSEEVPAGAMPRCVDVICRHECVELAKAGDKIVLTGTVAVLPDTSGLARAGETALANKGGHRSDNAEGVRGLRKLGVREMSYRLLFLACSVQPLNARTQQITRRHILPYFDDENDPSHVNHNIPDPTQDLPFILNTPNIGNTAHLEGLFSREKEVSLTASDVEEIRSMYHTTDLYNAMAESICPSVFGHMDIKRGILLMLLGGVHKQTVEGISLRGDLNVCLIGDPACAKSQFLTYTHNFLTRSVYTSGKSSTASGLTASVVRDVDTGEMCVQAGALMLADNGICCIDEFDKMDAADQVAIHEAMEQQTISIAKAGIHATLNARTAVLAAANPVFGRYDRTKTLKANISVSAAIMSRFDLFFVILDECNPRIDEAIATHIVQVHTLGGSRNITQKVSFKKEQLQRYIAFARTIQPVYTTRARAVLVECYRLLRNNDVLGKNKTAYRITVRQLESLIRLSEALARLHLDNIVREVYVREAYRLLQRSILFVESEDVVLENEQENVGSEEEKGDMFATEDDPERYVAQVTSLTEQPPHNDAVPSESAVTHDTTTQHTANKPTKTTSSSSHVTAKEYDEITQLVALRLRQEEDRERDDFVGVRWAALVDWAVEQFHLQDEDEMKKKRKLIHQIVRRMVKHEGALVVVRERDSEEDQDTPNEQKLLKLHPSWAL